MSASPPSSIVAAFDFDHTLTIKDSLLPFLISQQGRFKAYRQLGALSPDFIRYLLGAISRQDIKEKIMESFFKGMPYDDLKERGRQYADQILDSILQPHAMERARWHQQQGHRCLIVSASFDFYLIPWAKRHGFEQVIGSRLEVAADGRVTGRLAGKNCWGEEKKRRLIELLGPKQNYRLYVYGDSRGDFELLEMADYPFYRRFI